MELGIILTYFGLLFTAYSATQELQRVKLKLIPNFLKILLNLYYKNLKINLAANITYLMMIVFFWIR